MKIRALAFSALIAIIVSLCSCSLPWIHYENAPEKWRHQWIYSSLTACREAMDGIIAAADAGDREALKKMFAPNVYNQPGFDKELDDFLAAYPGSFSSDNADLSDMYDHGGVESSSIDAGVSKYRYSRGGHVTLNGEYYIMNIALCYIDDADKDAVGVTSFHIYTMNSWARYIENDDYDYYRPHYPEFEEEHALGCYMNRDREARLIDGDVFVFENDPEMTPVTEEQMNYVIVNGMDDGRLTTYDFSYMLEPFHGEERRKQYSNSASRAYKLESSGDEQRYAVFYRDQNDIVQYILIFTEGEYDSNNRNYFYSAKDYEDADESDDDS